jgi:hypothetical protein
MPSILFPRKISFAIIPGTVNRYFLLNIFSITQHGLSATIVITAVHFTGVNQTGDPAWHSQYGSPGKQHPLLLVTIF